MLLFSSNMTDAPTSGPTFHYERELNVCATIWLYKRVRAKTRITEQVAEHAPSRPANGHHLNKDAAWAEHGLVRDRMNFGPINQGGGEKRLNVIFSRAKQQMPSSRRSGTRVSPTTTMSARTDLRYADAVSRGHQDEMHACLNGVGETSAAHGVLRAADDAVATRISTELEAEGLLATRNFGHSMRNIDVAVRKPNEEEYARAILVDTQTHYAIPDSVDAMSHVPPFSAPLVGM
jgi:hypothetical protein